MVKIIHYMLFTFLSMLLLTANVFAAPATYKSPAGGYELTLPTERINVFSTPTELRFYHKNFLVSLDVLNLPASLKADNPSKLSGEELLTLEQLLLTTQDYPGYKVTKSQLNTVDDEGSYRLTLQNNNKLITNRDFVLAENIFSATGKLLTLRINCNLKDAAGAEQLLQTLSSNLKVSAPKEVKNNTLINNYCGYTIDLPLAWHTQTLNADNICFSVPLNDKTNTNGIIRTFATTDYATFSRAKNQELNKEETKFVERMSKFAENTTITKHKPVIISGLNGVLIEKTIKKDATTCKVIDCYLFTKSKGYQIKFTTNDSVNYPVQLKNFTTAINSFKTNKL
ncbi:MAG: hypothetical protein RR089_01835 [Acidaminococcaceae bacterium]